MSQMKTLRCGWMRSFVMAMLVLPTMQSMVLAGLINGGGDLVNDGTNAKIFDPTTPTEVINRYADTSLDNLSFIQVGFRTTNDAAFTVTNIGWSRDNVNYTAFAPSDFVSNVGAPPVYHYSSIVSLEPGFAGAPFFIRFTLPSGIVLGKVVESRFLANSNGATNGGVLDQVGGNTFFSTTRSHIASVPEPTSILLAASGSWLVFRAGRKRVKSARNAA